jgi:acetate---CoA ligase (ADP-forming)
MRRLERLLRPRSVAVIGASADPTKLTGRPIGYLIKHGFRGAIYPVNPRVAKIGGLRCYPDIARLPEAPDAAIVLVGQDRAQAAVAALAARGAGAAIVLAGGYGETGGAGRRHQAALREAAGGMRLLGPNTIGLVNLTDRIMLSATGALELDALQPGGIAVVSQSGGIMGSLLSRAADRGIGLSKLIATGNEADIDVADCIDFLVDDAATSVIAVYLEGLRDAAKFRTAVRRAVAAQRPVVVFKVGRSEAGARSAMSHTGALAGTDRMYEALFRQLGVIRAGAFADLLDIPAALVAGRVALGKRVAILTSTGGAGTLVADSCGMRGLDVPPPDDATAARLAALQPGEADNAARNPVDVTLAGLQPAPFRAAISALLDSPAYDAVVVVVGASALADPTLATDALIECRRHGSKPLLAYVSPHAPHIVATLNRNGVPAFAGPEGCAAALAAMQPRAPAAGPAEDSGSAAPDGLRSGPLDELESKQLFARFGIAAVREAVAATPAAAEAAARGLGDRIVVKLRSLEVVHKSEVGGVKLGVDPAAVATACETMAADLRRRGLACGGFLIQEMVRGGVEMILGFHRDPQLGPAVLLGYGGITAELFEDVAIRLLPIGRTDAQAMVNELKARKLLLGFRGAPPCDVPALIEAVLAFARMAQALGSRLEEAEINPLFVLPHGVLAADGLVVLA